ncbi:MAG TPA: hypothetical protein VNA88_08715 [Candidatus Kapabacteria bacterium]|jgi:hypothetical protein|nr:hypothetical protein [Candidatus Kapabacteria bacterium]
MLSVTAPGKVGQVVEEGSLRRVLFLTINIEHWPEVTPCRQTDADHLLGRPDRNILVAKIDALEVIIDATV